MNKNYLVKYAQLIVNTGVNVQKGQKVLIVSAVEAAELTKLVVEYCYKKQAKEVIVEWSCDEIHHTKIKNETSSTIIEANKYFFEQRNKIISNENGCYIRIMSGVPGILSDVEPTKVLEYTKALRTILKPTMECVTKSIVQWTIVAFPNLKWAKICFPKFTDEKALEKLTTQLLKCVKISSTGNPDTTWNAHNKKIATITKKLNNFNFKYLLFKNNKTNIKVGLVKDHIWNGGSHISEKWKAKFNANMPSEEVWCMPHNKQIDGVVYNTKPLNYQGQLIDKFWIKFKKGSIVDFDAKIGKQALSNLINFDKGTKSLGEVALVPVDSPISESNVLFYETLFDENASCHFAIGCSYPSNLKGGVKMDWDKLQKHGANFSSNHVDFMFGSSDMSIEGVTYDNKTIQIFKNGKYTI